MFRPIIFLLIFITSYSLKAQDNQEIKDQIDDLKTSVDSLKNKINKLTTKNVQFGISIGYRQLRSKFQDDFQSASISPIDSTLQLEKLSADAVILSTSVVFTPFINTDWLKEEIGNVKSKKKSLRTSIDALKSKDETDDMGKIRAQNTLLTFKKLFLEFLSNVGVQANLNLIDFTEAQENFSFNKNIEGGLGLSYRLSDKLYASAHYELFFSRQLRSHLKEREGEKITNTDGTIITDIGQIDKNDESFYITKNVLGFVYRIIVVF